jgi:hypothetical protein
MIFHWFMQALRFVGWLFVPPKPRDVARIDRCYPCPVCGARNGTIRCVERRDATSRAITFAQHTCEVCGARWHEQPVVKVTPSIVFPAIARNEREKIEDRWTSPTEGIQ